MPIMRFQRPATERAMTEFSIAGRPMLEALAAGDTPPSRIAVVVRKAVVLRMISSEFLLEDFDSTDLVR
jgi:hypothetical protein